ncbi:hypothetical protein HPP92_002863 [Vanilla planifolia]|uniref:Uncharacterized protein n=1 Tax=Vanilla planifolia TaxID=51239 RepID=A0A835VGP2_VANPL|nr:hypothetical protein HPP92_002863 [Vanilla planifolia]
MRRMRERSSSAKKHGEVSWPKIIFRKWLNLNNKESDFSADERDNNTDFDEEVEEEEDNVRAIPLLCVGTWNVGGKVPNHDLDIEEWLDTEDPADIYVLGSKDKTNLQMLQRSSFSVKVQAIDDASATIEELLLRLKPIVRVTMTEFIHWTNYMAKLMRRNMI